MRNKIKKIIISMLIVVSCLVNSVVAFGAIEEKTTRGPKGSNRVTFSIYNVGYGGVKVLEFKNTTMVNVDRQTINCINVVSTNGTGSMGKEVSSTDSRNLSYKSPGYTTILSASAHFEVISSMYGSYSYNLAY